MAFWGPEKKCGGVCDRFSGSRGTNMNYFSEWEASSVYGDALFEL